VTIEYTNTILETSSNDLDTVEFWGAQVPIGGIIRKTPNIIIIDIRGCTELLKYRLIELINIIQPDDEINELVNSVKNYILDAIIGFIQIKKQGVKGYDESMHHAIDKLLFYGIPIDLASSVVHNTEVSYIEAIMNYVPNLDDTDIIIINKHTHLDDGNICLFVDFIFQYD